MSFYILYIQYYMLNIQYYIISDRYYILNAGYQLSPKKSAFEYGLSFLRNISLSVNICQKKVLRQFPPNTKFRAKYVDFCKKQDIRGKSTKMVFGEANMCRFQSWILAKSNMRKINIMLMFCNKQHAKNNMF